jgi:hypothetical protein
MPSCHCKLCEHKRGVVTPLHPWAFEEWARPTDREREQRMARYNMTVEAKAEMMRRLIDR